MRLSQYLFEHPKTGSKGRAFVEVEVLKEDVSTFLILSPEEEYLGARVQGFIPQENGGMSALEMHGQVCYLSDSI